jgi:Family of unknown function (DUF6065)
MPRVELIAYRLGRHTGFSAPTPSPRWRSWADGTRERFANRCLPMLMANQAGWVICTPAPVEVLWRGGEDLDQLSVSWDSTEGARSPASSHFGHGILTWSIPFLFRTPPNYNLLVRGPPNSPKDGIAPLEGLVEADWAESPFTMNWKVTRPHTPIRFEQGEPICMVVPQRRGELEAFVPAVVDLRDEPETRRRYRAWSQSRREFLTQLNSGPVTETWQKHYFRGRSPSGLQASEHQASLRLAHFTEQQRETDPARGSEMAAEERSDG